MTSETTGVTSGDESSDNGALTMTFEVAMRAGIDAVWELIATGEGRAAWFGTQASIEPVVGGASLVSWDGEQPIDSIVTAIEVNRHLRLAYAFEGVEMGAEEYWLEHKDGTTHLRLIQTMAAGTGWEDFHGDLDRGWRLFLASLAFAADEAATPLRESTCAFVPAGTERPTAWSKMLERLSLPDSVALGDQVEVPVFGAGTIALVDAPNSLLVVQPGRTMLYDLEGSGEDVAQYVQAATHGPQGLAQAEWRAEMVAKLAGIERD